MASKYTKHYYIEGQRIASKIGAGLSPAPISYTTQQEPIYSNYEDLPTSLLNMCHSADECAGFISSNTNFGTKFKCIDPLSTQDNDEPNLYFYHSDHIGSSSFITDADGIASQHLQYLPFGETFVEQRSTANYYTPYKFSGKEKDEETSYSYFSQRYYLSDISIWASVDPLKDDYPYQSPYTYCAWNPVRIIDPDGMSEGNPDIYVFNNDGSYKETIPQAGEHTGRILGENGSPDVDFKFADPVNDPKAIDDKTITRAAIVTDEAICETLNSSGVFEKNNQKHKWSYIKTQSNATYGEDKGKMDYVITASLKIDGKSEKLIHGGNTLYVANTKSGYIGHNQFNFGNFLWGAGAKALGFSKLTAKLGAHFNNYMNDASNSAKPWYKRSFDSKDDQYSISLGVDWMKIH